MSQLENAYQTSTEFKEHIVSSAYALTSKRNSGV